MDIMDPQWPVLLGPSQVPRRPLLRQRPAEVPRAQRLLQHRRRLAGEQKAHGKSLARGSLIFVLIFPAGGVRVEGSC